MVKSERRSLDAIFSELRQAGFQSAEEERLESLRGQRSDFEKAVVKQERETEIKRAAIELARGEEEVLGLAYELEENWPPKVMPRGLSLTVDSGRGTARIALEDRLEGNEYMHRFVFSVPGRLPVSVRGMRSNADFSFVYPADASSDPKEKVVMADENGNYAQFSNKVDGSRGPAAGIMDGRPFYFMNPEASDFSVAQQGLEVMKTKLLIALGRNPTGHQQSR